MCCFVSANDSGAHLLSILPCSVFLVFEYVEHDMGRLLDTMPRPFTLPQVKCLVQQV